MGRRCSQNGVSSVQMSVDLLKTSQKARHCARTDGNVGSNLHVPVAQFAWNDLQALFGLRVLDPQQIRRQLFAETTMDFTDAAARQSPPAEAVTVNPLLDSDMRLCFKL